MVSLEYLLSFIEEDAPFGDLTSEVIIGDIRCRAALIARQSGIIAGIAESSMLLSHFGINAKFHVSDGNPIESQTVIASLEGPARPILLIERTVLNIIGRMSGIATKTSRMRALVESKNPGCRVACTRKTAPGLRALDKRAVMLGGGDPHRLTLSDGFLIKDNHLALTTVTEAISAARRSSLYRTVEVEVESPNEAMNAASAGADILLLDNMNPAEIQKTLDLLEREGLSQDVLIEVSGGIDEHSIGEYVIPGVDIVSLGSLTHSVDNFDVSLEITGAIRT